MPAMGRQLGRCPGRLFLFFRPGVGARIPADPCSFVPFAPSLRTFSALGRRRLGARIPAKPCSFVPFAPSLRTFSALGRRGLGAQTPARPCSFVPFAPSLRTFSALGRHGLGARTPAKPCSFVPFAPNLRAFSAIGRRGLGAQTPARPCSFVLFAPSLRAFSALGRQWGDNSSGCRLPAGALKAEKENGRGHSPFPLSLNRKLPAGRRKLTNCYSYAVYRSSRYLYRSSASFMYCDAPENIFDKLNQ